MGLFWGKLKKFEKITNLSFFGHPVVIPIKGIPDIRFLAHFWGVLGFNVYLTTPIVEGKIGSFFRGGGGNKSQFNLPQNL
jgi:hypothetical protein